MKIISPSVELWEQNNPKQHVARCARVCYGKENGNDEVTIKNLLARKHYSMFRHETVYAAIKYMDIKDMFNYLIDGYQYCPYINYVVYEDYVYIITNRHFMFDIKYSNPALYKWINENIISEEETKTRSYVYKHFMRYTFCVITQISTSRELNRVSPNNIAEQSTRYVYEDGSICCPHWIDINGIVYNSISKVICVYNQDNSTNNKAIYYLNSCEDAFANYKHLIKHFDMHRQDARGVLPIDTATKCVYTYSIDEWRDIIDLRYYGTTGKPHKNAKIIAGMIRNELIKLGYDFRD